VGKGPTREQILRERRAVDLGRQLTKLTLRAYQRLLAQKLRSLGLPPDVAESHLGFVAAFAPVPQSARFWKILAETMKHKGDDMMVFATRYEAHYGHKVPKHWAATAGRVAAGFSLLRGQMVQISGARRGNWERNGDLPALVSMVRADGVRSRWVCEAITALRDRQITGNASERSRATAQLRQIGKALGGIGRAPREPTPPDQRRAPNPEKRRHQYSVAARQYRRDVQIETRLEVYTNAVAAGVGHDEALRRALRRLRTPTRDLVHGAIVQRQHLRL
jgi:hypothetical protein